MHLNSNYKSTKSHIFSFAMIKITLKRKLLLLAILASALVHLSIVSADEATIDEYGNVVTSEGGQEEIDESIPANEELSIFVLNQSPFRVDVYWDDGQYGHNVATLEKGKSGAINSYVGHSFFVTRHGVKEGLFTDAGTDHEQRLLFTVGKRNQKFIIPEHAAPSTNPCQDRFSICKEHASNGGCERSPGWMIVHCCKSCDPYLNSKELIDPAKRCSKEQLKTPENIWKAGDLNKMFDSWANNQTLKDAYGFEVVSAPDCEKYGATWENCIAGSPWVVLFNDFLNDNEVADLIRGGEIEGYERSTDQGAANALGEQEKIVSLTRTSSNAWCMHKCERLPGVRTATTKIEDVTGIPRKNYESFQLLNYGQNQFYRAHHDSSMRDDSPPGPRILTFFLYLTDVEEGGETHFNKLGLAVKPKKGRALVWPSVIDSDPEFWDARMTHEAKDVIKGKKLAANHWIHLNDYVTPNEWGCTGSFS
ncbi:hypothetical protein ACHAW6_001821 [Cyclotella cf. meneghiniana]